MGMAAKERRVVTVLFADAGALDRLEVPNTIRAVYLGQLDDLPDTRSSSSGRRR